MNLSQLRDLVLDLRAWTSSGTTFDARLNRAINLAYRKMSKDVPEVLVPAFESHYVFKDHTTASTKAKVRLKSSADRWTLEFTDASGDIFGAASPALAWKPQFNGTWDGLMHIEVTDSAGAVHRYKCREFWTDGTGGSLTYLVSIDRPFQALSSGVLHDFRIHQPTVWLKSDYIRVTEVSAWDPEYRDDRLEKIDLALVDRHKLRDFRGTSNGKPQAIFSNQHMQLPAPGSAPTFGSTGGGWVGTTVASGEFTFKYTFATGVETETENTIRYSNGGYKEPIIESAPSPESAKMTFARGETTTIAMAPIDDLMNFGVSALDPRAYHSGVRLRLYAARHSTVTIDAGGFAARLAAWPADKKYYLIADVETVLDSATGGYIYQWLGNGTGLDSGIPDMTKTLRENHVYRGWSLYPHQEKDFRIDFRVLRPPDALESDADHPMIEPDAESALVELVMYYLCLMDGADQAGAQAHLGNYGTELKSVRNQHASPAGSVMPSTWDEAGIRVWNPGTFEEL